MQVATQGYIGFGFSPNGGMAGADMILSWISSTGKIHLQVRWLTSFKKRHSF